MPPDAADETIGDGEPVPAMYLTRRLDDVALRSPVVMYATIHLEGLAAGAERRLPVRPKAQADELPEDIDEVSVDRLFGDGAEPRRWTDDVQLHVGVPKQVGSLPLQRSVQRGCLTGRALLGVARGGLILAAEDVAGRAIRGEVPIESVSSSAQERTLMLSGAPARSGIVSVTTICSKPAASMFAKALQLEEQVRGGGVDGAGAGVEEEEPGGGDLSVGGGVDDVVDDQGRLAHFRVADDVADLGDLLAGRSLSRIAR